MDELFVNCGEDCFLDNEAEELETSMDDVLSDGTDIDTVIDGDDDTVEYNSDSDAQSASEIEDIIDADDLSDFDLEED